MIPGQRRRKEEQEKERREAQVENKIHDLKEKNESLRRIAFDLLGALRSIRDYGDDPQETAKLALTRLESNNPNVTVEPYRQCLRDVKGYLLSNTWTRSEIAEYIDRVLDGDATTLDSGPDTPRYDPRKD